MRPSSRDGRAKGLLSTGALAILVAVATFAANSPAIDNEWIEIDDNRIVIAAVEAPVDDPILTHQLGHPAPGTYWLYRAVHAVWDVDPTPYHVVNVLMATAAAAGMVFLLAALFGDRQRRWYRPLLLVLGALAFVTHPMSAQAIAFVTSLKDVGQAPWLIAAATVLIRGGREERARQRVLVVFMLFVVAVSFKPVAAAFAGVFAWWMVSERGRIDRWSVFALVGMVALGLNGLHLTRVYQAEIFGNLNTLPPSERVVLVGHVFFHQLTRYLHLFVDTQMFPYQWQYARDLVTPAQTARNLLVLGAALVSSARCLVSFGGLDPRTWRPKPLTPFRFGLVWTWAFFAPVAGLFGNVNIVVADRYVFTVLVGPALMLSAGLARALERAEEPGPREAAVVGVAFALLMAMAGTQRSRLDIYDTAHTIYVRGMQEFPEEKDYAMFQRLCVRHAATYAYEHRGPTGRAEVGRREYERVLRELRPCDPEHPLVQLARQQVHALLEQERVRSRPEGPD